MSSNPLVGTWKLVSFEMQSGDGPLVYPFGPDPVGYIIYTPDGHVSVAFMSRGRPPVASGDMKRTTDDERRTMLESYMSYCGRYEIQGSNVVHHLEVSLWPNWTGGDQVRAYELAGDRLTLSTQPILRGGELQVGRLVWERVKA